MTVLRKSILVGAMLLTSSVTAFAEDAHHPADDTAETPPAPLSEPLAQPGADAAGNMMSGPMMSGGMMSDDMMKMMMNMMSGGGHMGQMMSPNHVEGRIAFLRTELKLTEAQQPLWDAVADVLRANARAAKDMVAGMPGGMISGDSAAATPLKRIELQERMFSTRLEGLRRLKDALEPFYATLGKAQKAEANKLLVPAPMGLM